MEKTQFETIQETLRSLDVSSLIEKKKDSKGNEKSYLSWSNAWGTLIKYYPNASYEVERFDGLPFLRTKEGYMVFTKVTICDVTREMWLPVQDVTFETMKEEPYEITYKSGSKKVVGAADMGDVNRAIMRCLVKNIAMFGLGINVYQGEEFPNVDDLPSIKPKEKIFCEECGLEVLDHGKATAEQIANRSKMSYGRIMCYDCAVKQSQKQADSKGEQNA